MRCSPCRRDDFTHAVRQNVVAAYEFLVEIVTDNLDLFSDDGLEAPLRLNHLVLLGRACDRREFGRHIDVTRQQFFDNFHRYVKPIRRWYRKHETENPYKVAGRVYVGCLSQPQLRQEGNHRTGSLICERHSAAKRLPAIRPHAPKCSRLFQSVIGDQVH